MTYPIHVILLAAGLSRRMGEANKLLLDINGTPMVRHMAELYVSLFASLTIVTGYEADKIKAALSGLNDSFVHNQKFETGQQSSIRSGLSAIPLKGEGVLIALADQPYLTEDDIRNYAEAFLASSRDKIFIPYFEDERGNPVIFPVSILKKMKAIGDPINYRKFVDENPHLTTKYQAPTRHFVEDIDTQDDLNRLSVNIDNLG